MKQACDVLSDVVFKTCDFMFIIVWSRPSIASQQRRMTIPHWCNIPSW